MNKLEAFTEIVNTIKKFNKVDDYCLRAIFNQAESRRKEIEISEKFGINIDYSGVGNSYFNLNDYESIGFYDGEKRKISWSDDDRQPKNEWLYCLKFSCGAYTFHEDYPEKAFGAFFKELKDMSPKYMDTKNHSLYFDEKGAKDIHMVWRGLAKKYGDEVKREINYKRIRELEEEIERISK